MADLVAARAAKQHLLEQLAGAPGVNGVGLTRRAGEYALKVGLVEPGSCAVPAEVDGVAVVVEVVGEVRALAAAPGAGGPRGGGSGASGGSTRRSRSREPESRVNGDRHHEP